MKKNVAVVGCGNISWIYLKNLTELFSNTNVYAVCDIDPEKTKATTEKYDVKVMTLDEILKDENVDIVLNVTTPLSHYSICKEAILAKKSVYVEKPLSVTYEEGKELVELAEKNGVLLGCAPDTFMGAGIHTARKIIEDGLIGDIIGATAFFSCPGHERWHPDPAFYYKKGGGPMFDMGPYYMTALVNLLGPVKSVSGMSSCLRKQRVITSKPKYGEIIDVEVPTHVNGLLKFHSGAIGNVMMSFDCHGSNVPRIEIHGTKGSLSVPDPNTFGGQGATPVMIKQSFDTAFHEFPFLNKYTDNSRGLGVSDMAHCLIENSKENCANGKVALHVLEIMEKVILSSDEKKELTLESYCEKPRISPVI